MRRTKCMQERKIRENASKFNLHSKCVPRFADHRTGLRQLLCVPRFAWFIFCWKVRSPVVLQPQFNPLVAHPQPTLLTFLLPHNHQLPSRLVWLQAPLSSPQGINVLVLLVSHALSFPFFILLPFYLFLPSSLTYSQSLLFSLACVPFFSSSHVVRFTHSQLHVLPFLTCLILLFFSSALSSPLFIIPPLPTPRNRSLFSSLFYSQLDFHFLDPLPNLNEEVILPSPLHRVVTRVVHICFLSIFMHPSPPCLT